MKAHQLGWHRPEYSGWLREAHIRERSQASGASWVLEGWGSSTQHSRGTHRSREESGGCGGAGRSCWPMGIQPQSVSMISRDLLRNTVPSATSAVLWKRVDLTLCSHNNNNNKTAHLPLLLGPSAFLTAGQTLDSL